MTTGTPTPGGTGAPMGAALGVTFTTSGACAAAGPTRAKDTRVAAIATLRMRAPFNCTVHRIRQGNAQPWLWFRRFMQGRAKAATMAGVSTQRRPALDQAEPE